MATFNISGSCVLRDAFGFQESSIHNVKQFLQFSSPITWFFFPSKPDKEYTIEDLDVLTLDSEVKNNFSKKCVTTDYNRKALEYFTEKADFFIVDLIELTMYGLIEQRKKDGTRHYFTKTNQVMRKNSNGQSFYEMLEGEKNDISVSEYLSEKVMDKIVDGLYDYLIDTLGYNEKQIILVRTLHALDYYFLDENIIRQFINQDDLKWQNEKLNYIYDRFEEKFIGCNVVRIPSNIYAVYPHKWGFHTLHFNDNLYNYLHQSFSLIANNRTNEIRSLCNDLEKYVESKRNFLSFLGRCAQIENDDDFDNGSIKKTLFLSKINWVSLESNKSLKTNSDNQIEALRLSVNKAFSDETKIDDNVHIYYAVKIGPRAEWTDTYSDGQMVGATDLNYPIHAIKIWIDEKANKNYDIHYMVHTKKNNEIEASNGEPIDLEFGEPIINLFCWLEEK